MPAARNRGPVRLRRVLAVLIALALLPFIWWRTPPVPYSGVQALALARVTLPGPGLPVGPLRLDGAWVLTSPNSDFGGYSALAQVTPGRLLALSDRGYFLDFALPGEGSAAPARIGSTIGNAQQQKAERDVEAASFDPLTRRLWLALEGRNAVVRTDPQLLTRQAVRPAIMADWAGNTGPEAMVRLADGRFAVLSEAYLGWYGLDRHKGVLFPRDPVDDGGAGGQGFTFAGPAGFRPTDMAQLPDGRVLVLMRRLLWPAPARFSAALVVADPAQLRAGGVWHSQLVTRLEAPLPVDNFEAMALVPGADGHVTLWLLSDDNGAVAQSTMLWRLRLDPRTLPRARQTARDR